MCSDPGQAQRSWCGLLRKASPVAGVDSTRRTSIASTNELASHRQRTDRSGRNRSWPTCVQTGMEEVEREAIRAEGLGPDDPAVVTAIDLVRLELSMLCRQSHGNPLGPFHVGCQTASREATSVYENEPTRCWPQEHNREEAHRTSALTGSIPVSRTRILAGQSLFLGQDRGGVHKTSTTAGAERRTPNHRSWCACSADDPHVVSAAIASTALQAPSQSSQPVSHLIIAAGAGAGVGAVASARVPAAGIGHRFHEGRLGARVGSRIRRGWPRPGGVAPVSAGPCG